MLSENHIPSQDLLKGENLTKKMITFFDNDLSDRSGWKHHLHDIEEAENLTAFNRDIGIKIKEFLSKSTLDEDFGKNVLDILYSRKFDQIDDGVEEEVMEKYNDTFKQVYEALHTEGFDTQKVNSKHLSNMHICRNTSEDVLEALQSKYKQYGGFLYNNTYKDGMKNPPPLMRVVNFDDKVGYINPQTNEEIVPCIYDQKSEEFRQGFAKVVSDEGAFYINEHGKEMFGPFEEGNDFSEGLASVKKDDVWYFINEKGNKVFEETFKYNPGGFHNGYAIIPPSERGYSDNVGDYISLIDRVGTKIKIPDNMQFPWGKLSSESFVIHNVMPLLNDSPEDLYKNKFYLFDIQKKELVLEYTCHDLFCIDGEINYLKKSPLFYITFLNYSTRERNLAVFNNQGKKIVDEKQERVEFTSPRKGKIIENDDGTIKIDAPTEFNGIYVYDYKDQELKRIQ